MTDTAIVSKWGNSLGVRIPKALTASLNITEGDTISLEIKKVNQLPKTLDEYLKENNWDGKAVEEKEVDFGQPAGEEIW